MNSFQLANRFLDQLNNPPENKAHIGVASLCSDRGVGGTDDGGALGTLYALFPQDIAHTLEMVTITFIYNNNTFNAKIIDFLKQLWRPNNLKMC